MESKTPGLVETLGQEAAIKTLNETAETMMRLKRVFRPMNRNDEFYLCTLCDIEIADVDELRNVLQKVNYIPF